MRNTFLILSIACCAPLFSQEAAPRRDSVRWQARSVVETKFGIVATSQTWLPRLAPTFWRWVATLSTRPSLPMRCWA